jgi:isoquinoline 1-oxidoreductase beta subunit
MDTPERVIPSGADTGGPDTQGVAGGVISRRRFLEAGGAAGLLLVLEWPGTAAAQAAPRTTFGDTQLAAFLEFTPDNRVRFTLPDAEMGQGIYSALPLILADELGADWETLEVWQSGADDRMANPMKGFQATGRSMTLRGFHPLLRRLGATARTLFTEAAARRLGVPAGSLSVAANRVHHAASGRALSFAELLPLAATLPLPLEVKLRSPGELTLTGRRIPRKDIPPKVTGEAEFALDIRLPGMGVAAIRQSPVFGSPVVSVDDGEARILPGVRAVVRLKDAVAVVADNYWQAERALARVQVRFAGSPNDRISSGELERRRRAGLSSAGVVARNDGDAPAALARASRRFEAVYDLPYLAHATMEPMTCTAHVQNGRCELWAPTQGPGRLRNDVARALGLPTDRITIHRMFVGGGFGRRWQTDFGVQAALISRAAGMPVKLIWSRTEDLQHDWYRPAMTIEVKAGLTAEGRLQGFDVGLSGALLSGWGRPVTEPRQPDPQLLGGLQNTPYRFADFRIRWLPHENHVPIGVWRSVAYSHNIFAVECAMDELAWAAGRDPLEFRLELLAHSARHRRVLEAVARRAGWGRELPAGEGLGISLGEYGGSLVAQVAHVVKGDGGGIRVRRITCAVDCGPAIQPDNVVNQVEGAVVFGLSAVLYGEVPLEEGRAQVTNFHDYRLVKLVDCPDIDVELLVSDAPLGGIGEAGVPAVAPAVVNAVFAATGRRVRELPLTRSGLVI